MVNKTFYENRIVQTADPTVQQSVNTLCAHCKTWTDFQTASRLQAWDIECYRKLVYGI